jgi:hypothetical protein
VVSGPGDSPEDIGVIDDLKCVPVSWDAVELAMVFEPVEPGRITAEGEATSVGELVASSK